MWYDILGSHQCGLTFNFMNTVFLLLTHRLAMIPLTVGVMQQSSRERNKRRKLINLSWKWQVWHSGHFANKAKLYSVFRTALQLIPCLHVLGYSSCLLIPPFIIRINGCGTSYSYWWCLYLLLFLFVRLRFCVLKCHEMDQGAHSEKS